MERSHVMAKSLEAGRREARSRSVSHRRNLSASWDRDSPPPPPAPVFREEKVNHKEKELHSVARNKVVTNPMAKSIPRKVKDMMTHEETQDVARSPACRRMKRNLREQYTPPKVPNWPVESPPSPPPSVTREGKVNPGEKELHSVACSKVKNEDQPTDPVHPKEDQGRDDPEHCQVPVVLHKNEGQPQGKSHRTTKPGGATQAAPSTTQLQFGSERQRGNTLQGRSCHRPVDKENLSLFSYVHFTFKRKAI